MSSSVKLEEEDKRLLALYQAIANRIEEMDTAITQAKDASEIDHYLHEHLSLAYSRMRWDLRSKRDEVLSGREQKKRHDQARQARIKTVKPGQTLLDYEGRRCLVIRWNRGKNPSISVRLPDGTRKAFPPYHFSDVAPEEVSPMNQENDPHMQEMLRISLEAAVSQRLLTLARWGGPNDRDRERAQSFVEDFIGPKGTDLFFKSAKPGGTAERFNQLAEALAVLAFVPGGVNFLGMHFEAASAFPAPGLDGTPAEDVPNQPPEEVIALLKEEGWQTRQIGPWCPECAPLLKRRAIGRPPRLILGQTVYKKYSRDPLGILLSLGDGYAEVRMTDGSSSVFALSELTTRSYPFPPG